MWRPHQELFECTLFIATLHVCKLGMRHHVFLGRRKEAARDARREPLLSSFMYASILSYDNFQDCLAFVLANRLSTPTLLATECYETFQTVFREDDSIVQAALADLAAIRERVSHSVQA